MTQYSIWNSRLQQKRGSYGEESDILSVKMAEHLQIRTRNSEPYRTGNKPFMPL